MTKVKSSTKRGPTTPKGNIKSIKEPVISKNKTPKFKNTPTGKVALINGSTPKGDGKKNSSKISAQNGKGQSPQNKQKNSNGKQNSPKNKKKLAVQAQKSPGDKQNIKKSDLSLENENDSDSDSDINEGITIKEEVSGIEDHDESDEEDDDEDKPGLTDILGDSLANESDEDDDDFEEDDDEDENEDMLDTKNKGVKMFKGLKTEQGSESIESDNDDEEDNDNDDDNDDDEEEEVESGPGLKVLLGNSLADDDDDDDFDENDEDDDDDDEDITDEDEEEEAASPAKKQKQSPATTKKKVSEDSINDDDDDDEDEDEDEDKDEGEGEGEDEDEDEDENENVGVDTPRLTKEEIEERNKRSIYIGNVPKDITTNEIKKVFSKYGPIETIRIRGAIPENPKMSAKGAAITKKIHPKVSTIHMFILFKSEESVQKALEMNGKQLNGNYLRVDICRTVKDGLYDTKKAVFIGNLPFDANDNMIWTHFAECGKITSVRVVKDNKTGVGRGFGYINFETPDDVTLALKLDGSKIGNREIRVQLYEKRTPNRNWQNNGGKRQFQGKRQYNGCPKKFKNDSGDSNQSSPNDRRKAGKRSQGEQQRQNTEGGSPRGKGRASFQGQRSNVKKVSQSGKFEKKKKIMAAKLTSKPKKPMAN